MRSQSQPQPSLDPVAIALSAMRKALEQLPDDDQYKLHALAVNELGLRLHARGDIYMVPRALASGLKVLEAAGVDVRQVERLVELAREWIAPPF